MSQVFLYFCPIDTNPGMDRCHGGWKESLISHNLPHLPFSSLTPCSLSLPDWSHAPPVGDQGEADLSNPLARQGQVPETDWVKPVSYLEQYLYWQQRKVTNWICSLLFSCAFFVSFLGLIDFHVNITMLFKDPATEVIISSRKSESKLLTIRSHVLTGLRAARVCQGTSTEVPSWAEAWYDLLVHIDQMVHYFISSEHFPTNEIPDC